MAIKFRISLDEALPIVTNTPNIFVPCPFDEGLRTKPRLRPEPLPLHKFRSPSRINYFPQYVMHVSVFLSIYREKTARFRSWRELINLSLITIMDSEKQKSRDAEILFISHEWASRSHPDPEGIQLRCLYDTLKRMVKGEYSKYGTYLQSMYRGHWNKDTKIDWKEKMKRLYLWIDYQSIPQVSDNPTYMGREMDIKATSAAITSIASYISRCSYIFILLPEIKHEVRGYMNYRTWFNRGWCKFEMLCEFLNDVETRVFCVGRSYNLKHRTLNFERVHFDLQSLVHGGEFTCCELHRERNASSNHENCDKISILIALKRMISEKILRLFHGKNRDLVGARFHVVMRRSITDSLKTSLDSHKALEEAKNMTVAKLKTLLLWRTGKDDEDAKKTNWSLLKFAILGCHKKVVSILLKSREAKGKKRGESNRTFGTSLLEPIKKNTVGSPQVVGYLRPSVTNLHLAMAFASPKIVAMLLETGIPTNVRVDNKFLTPLSFGVRHNNIDTVKYWVQRFPNSVGLNSKGHNIFGISILSIACYQCTHNRIAMFRTLLDAGAPMNMLRPSKGNIFRPLMASSLTDVPTLKWMCERYKNVFGEKELLRALNRVLTWKDFCFFNKVLSILTNMHLKYGIFRNTVFDSAFKAHAIGIRSPIISFAAHRNDRALTLELLSQGCNPYIANGQGISAWDQICKFDFEDEAREAMEDFKKNSKIFSDDEDEVSTKEIEINE